MGYDTPPGFHDGFTDGNRPHDTKALLYISGQPIRCSFHAGHRQWYPLTGEAAPQIQIQQASPMTPHTAPVWPNLSNLSAMSFQSAINPPSSPVPQTASYGPPFPFPQTTLPSSFQFTQTAPQPVVQFRQDVQTTVQFSQASPQSQVQFPDRDKIKVESVPGVFTAKEVLDCDVPEVTVLSLGLASTSSRSNGIYPNVNQLFNWDLPECLGGYARLPQDSLFAPPQLDPTIEISVEADAIWASRLYLLTPVNTVFSHMSPYKIRCSAEDSHSVRVRLDNKMVEHLSRVDLSWSVEVREGHWNKFALLEFKRRGAICGHDWGPGFNNEPLVGSAKKICQQLTKYGHTFGTRFVGVSDWDTLVLLRLCGTREAWASATIGEPVNIGAYFRWISDRHEIKRNLYVFLKEALEHFLRGNS